MECAPSYVAGALLRGDQRRRPIPASILLNTICVDDPRIPTLGIGGFCIKKTPRLTRGSVNAMRLTRNPPTVRIELRSANCNQTKEEDNMGLNDINSLSHS